MKGVRLIKGKTRTCGQHGPLEWQEWACCGETDKLDKSQR